MGEVQEIRRKLALSRVEVMKEERMIKRIAEDDFFMAGILYHLDVEGLGNVSGIRGKMRIIGDNYG